MAGTTDATVARRQLSRRLRELREAVPMTQEQAAELMEWSVSKLSRIEKGQNGVRAMDVENMCNIYRRPDQADRLGALARAAKNRSWWHAYSDVIPEGFDVYIGLEPAADRFRWYESGLIPGIFQTADYARTLIRTDHPEDTADEIERRVQLRLTRQSLLTREDSPQRWHVVLDEAILHRPIGSPAIMLAQLERLLEVSELPNVTIRIVPFHIGMHTGVTAGSHVLLDFPNSADAQFAEATTVYVEGWTGALCIDQADVVARYERAFDGIARAALSSEDSRAMISKAVKEMNAK
ncbi:Uncharacterised protein [Nocardia otitidiscaviarum]|uniref:HTH cro/C1-type domain-containing protein n=2 Tax=Nocardia otitidiscaviarum TaxID=1823 RepID=A0A379JMH1_9NOCA|nr:helix-turn-helix transcriptional regulator [Nocardia otitidiscaviarum]SUD49544.1 Uncharacterised protein [Nocardia otitidiscaviarum]